MASKVAKGISNRNPKITTSRSESVVSGIGRRVGTHIGGRGLGNIIAKSIRIGERVSGAIIKSPFRLASKVARRIVSRNSRDSLIRANRVAETSKFRRKMLDLLGIISKKDTQGTSTPQTSSSGSNGIVSTLAIAASIGAAILGIKALVDNMSKETKDKINKFLYETQEKMKDTAQKAAYEFQEYIKKWLYDNNPLKEIGEKLGSKIFDFISTLNNFGEKLGSKLFDIVNGVEKLAGNVADKALEISTDIYNAPGKAVDYVYDMVKNSPPGKAIQRDINEIVANNPFPDYVSGMKNSNKFTPNKDYNNIANSLNKPSTSPTLRQLEVQQKQADNLQRDRDKSSSQPVIINNSSNTKETPNQQQSIVRLGTRNLDSSNQQLQRSILSGGYIGTGFLVQ